MADTGFAFPVTGSNDPIASNPNWLSASNITADDANSAGCSVNNGSSDRLLGTDYNFASIPNGATIDGIEVQIVDYNFTGSGNVVWSQCNVRREDQTLSSTNNASQLTAPTGSLQTDLAGGPSDLWGETGWDKTEVNDIDFGAGVVVLEDAASSSVMNIDAFRMKIYYTAVSVTDVAASDETPGSGTETFDEGEAGCVATGTNFT